jgi:hypothetical protein
MQSVIRATLAKRTVAMPMAKRFYADPAANEAGKKQAEKAKQGQQEVDHAHQTQSEAAVRGEHDKKSIDELQKETVNKVCKSGIVYSK